MKKSKLTKETAYPSAPTLSNGFVPPVDFDYKISVDLRGRDIKIYGFTGSQWELLHDTDGVINDFITDIVHQKYYLESKTGSNQTVRVNFLSSLTEPNLHSFEFGVTDGARRLHHFDDVPVYRGGDQGKFLTVMTNLMLLNLKVAETQLLKLTSWNILIDSISLMEYTPIMDLVKVTDLDSTQMGTISFLMEMMENLSRKNLPFLGG